MPENSEAPVIPMVTGPLGALQSGIDSILDPILDRFGVPKRTKEERQAILDKSPLTSWQKPAGQLADKLANKSLATGTAATNMLAFGLPNVVTKTINPDLYSAVKQLQAENPAETTMGNIWGAATSPPLLKGANLPKAMGGPVFGPMLASGLKAGLEFGLPRAVTGSLENPDAPGEVVKQLLTDTLAGGAVPAGLGLLQGGKQALRAPLEGLDKWMNSPAGKAKVPGTGVPLGPLRREQAFENAIDTQLAGQLDVGKGALQSLAKKVKSDSGYGPFGTSKALTQAKEDTANLAKQFGAKNADELFAVNQLAKNDYQMLMNKLDENDFVNGAVTKEGEGVKGSAPSWVKSTPAYESLKSNPLYDENILHDRINTLKKEAGDSRDFIGTINDRLTRDIASNNARAFKQGSQEAGLAVEMDKAILDGLRKLSVDKAERSGEAFNFSSGVKTPKELDNLYRQLGLTRFAAEQQGVSLAKPVNSNASPTGSVMDMVLGPAKTAISSITNKAVAGLLNKFLGGKSGDFAQFIKDPNSFASLASEGMSPEAMRSIQPGIGIPGFQGQGVPEQQNAPQLGALARVLQQIKEASASQPPVAQAPQPYLAPGGQPGTAYSRPTSPDSDYREITDSSPGQQPADPIPGPISRFANPAPGPLATALQGLQPQQAVQEPIRDFFDTSEFAQAGQSMGTFDEQGQPTRYGQFVDSLLRNIYLKNRFANQGISYQDFYGFAANQSGGFNPVQVANFDGAFPTEESKKEFLKSFQQLQSLNSVDFTPLEQTWSNTMDSIFNSNYATAKMDISNTLAGILGDEGSQFDRYDKANKFIDSIMDKWNVPVKEKVLMLKKAIASKIGINTGDIARLGLDRGTVLEGIYGK